ncbi:glycosyltransferase [Candidatus Sumerlaeota bacterium]|nr:glycosyltransferase [Candidatus Sumerlaeota bacterium]
MVRKKHHSDSSKSKRPATGRQKKRILLFSLTNCTIAPVLERILPDMGCELTNVVAQEIEGGGLELISHRSWESIIAEMIRLKHDAVILINSKGIDDGELWLAVAETFRIPVFNWFTDHPRFCPWRPVEIQSDALHVVLWDAGYTEELIALGYRHVHPLPLAADSRIADSLADEPLDPPCDVAFVGSLSDHRIRALREELMARLEKAKHPDADEANRLIEKGRQWTREHRGRSIFQYADSIDPESLPEDEFDKREAVRLIAAIIDFENMRDDRLELASALRDKGLQVWGDAAWKDQIPSEQFRGFVSYQDVGRIYHDARIIVNLSRGQLLTAVNQRVYDAPMCGGFLITDRRPGLADILEPGVDMAVYDDVRELPGLIDEYLANESLRREMSARAKRRIMDAHLYEHRVQTLFQWIEEAHQENRSTKALPLAPEWQQRLARVAPALVAEGHIDEAQQLANALSRRGDMTPYGEVVLAVSDLFGARKDVEKAYKRLKRAHESGVAESRPYYALTLANLKQFDEVVHVIGQTPEDERLALEWRLLGHSWRCRNQPRQALQAYDRALMLEPNNKEILAAIELLQNS